MFTYLKWEVIDITHDLVEHFRGFLHLSFDPSLVPVSGFSQVEINETAN